MSNSVVINRETEVSKSNQNNNNILNKYYSKLYQLESRSLRTSFGKMIPSKNQSNPQYSFGKEVRIPRAKKPKTDYLYNPEPTNGFKFDKSPKWGFSKSPRKELYDKEIYEHYKNPYNKAIDNEKIKLKWNRPIGGNIGTENRMKRILEQSSPGPGKYDPSIRYARYHNGSAGYMGMKSKTNAILVPVGTHGEVVAPTSYEIGEKSDVHKFSYSPKYSFGHDQRKSLGRKKYTKDETYAVISSCGEQVLAPKESVPQYSFGKSQRFPK